VAALVVAYAVSPIDLIPDFIPVLGYLDDMIILPLGIMLAVKMIPAVVMEESRAKAGDASLEKKKFSAVIGAVIVVIVWMIIIVAAVVFGNKLMARQPFGISG
jgi:hypothetical protein